jgi:hypothetical protein
MFAITTVELEAMIKVEMEEICEWPTDMTVSVQPDRDIGNLSLCKIARFDAGRHDMILLIADRLRCEFDLKHRHYATSPID